MIFFTMHKAITSVLLAEICGRKAFLHCIIQSQSSQEDDCWASRNRISLRLSLNRCDPSYTSAKQVTNVAISQLLNGSYLNIVKF